MERAELAHALGAPAIVAEPGGDPVVIEERDPARFMEKFAAAVAAGADVFLADPNWGAKERAQLAALLQSKIENPKSKKHRGGWLMIPTGGTSGQIKFARHDEDTVSAAVRGFTAHFGLERVNALGLLPLHHVSGLMAWMRAALTGGAFQPTAWKQIEGGERPELAAGTATVVSLVPTQLQRLLAQPEAVAWLRGFQIIFLGGGPSWPALLEEAARVRLRVSLSYGMTETAAMVAALTPADFLAGTRSSGAALPHARVTADADGVLHIAGDSIFRGYWPEWNEAREFITEDLGRLDERGHVHVLGRRDATIITGGEKVRPGDVEAALRASGEFADVAVLGVPDAEWGEMVVACYPAGGRAPELAKACAALSGPARPKRFVAVADWPRNAQGKINRAALRAAVENAPR